MKTPQYWWKYALPALAVVSVLPSVGAGATAHFRAVSAGTGAAAPSNGPNVTQEEAVKSVWDGVYTEEQAQRGQATYLRECSSCHLDDLLGDGIAPALIGQSFGFRWHDLSVGDVIATIRTTMPEGAPASLSMQAYVDIAAYLLKVNQYPAGEEELERDVSTLDQIMIEAKRPEQP